MIIDIEATIKQWLLSGVTYKEIQTRLSWLGIVITEQEIKEIEAK